MATTIIYYVVPGIQNAHAHCFHYEREKFCNILVRTIQQGPSSSVDRNCCKRMVSSMEFLFHSLILNNKIVSVSFDCKMHIMTHFEVNTHVDYFDYKNWFFFFHLWKPFAHFPCVHACTDYRKYIKVDFSSKKGKCIGVAFCIKPFFHLKGNVTVNVDDSMFLRRGRL